MPPTALDTFSTFGVIILCMVLAIMALTLFFKGLNWRKGGEAKPETMAIRGVLKKGTWATVHMTGAKSFDRVRFLGFTNYEGSKNYVPGDLHGMVILEDPEGRQFLVRSKAIRMIVIEPPTPSAPSLATDPDSPADQPVT